MNKNSFFNTLAMLPTACFLLDGAGTILFANAALLELVAYSKEQLVGAKLEKIARTWNNKKYNSQRLADIFLGEHALARLVLNTGSDNTVSTLLNASVQNLKDGETYYIGLLTPDGRPQPNSLGMSKSEARFTTSFSSDSRGMALINCNGRWTKVNSALCRILGYNQRELLKTTFQSLTYSQDLNDEVALFTKLVNGDDRGYKLEKRFYQKNSECVSTLATVSAIREPNSANVEFLYEVSDISQVKKTEAQLKQAQKLEAVGHLTCGISHDFGNALAIIQNNLDLLEPEDISNTDAAKRIRVALNAVQGAAALTRRLLEFSAERPPESRLVNVKKFLMSAYEMVDHAVGDQVQLTTRPGARLWLTSVDPAQLESVLVNLALNARDAMPNGGRLDITAKNVSVEAYSTGTDAEPDSLSGDFVQISVTDNGFGIPIKFRSKLFQPFFTTKPPGKGTGLGLSMVYGFVKQYGGHIKVSSEENSGTTVDLYLPRYEKPPATVDKSECGMNVEEKAESVNGDMAGVQD